MVVSILLMSIVLYVSAFFLPITRNITTSSTLIFDNFFNSKLIFGGTPLSGILAVTLLLLTAFSIFVLDNTFSTGINHILPLIYIFFVSTNPNSVFLTPMHAVALLLIWSFFFSVDYRVKGLKLESLLKSFFLLSCASFFYAPVLWLFPIMFAINIRSSEDKIKFIFISIIGTILPFIFLLGTDYLINGCENTVELINRYCTLLVNIEEKFFPYSAAKIFKIIVIVIFSIQATVYLLKRMNSFKIAKSRSLTRIITYLFFLIIIVFFFNRSDREPTGLIIYIPISIILSEYISTNYNRKQGMITNLIIMCAIIIERLAYLI